MSTAIILAGAGSPDGPPALFPVGAGTLIGQALKAVESWPVNDRVVVLGSEAETILTRQSFDFDVIIDYDWEDGTGSSLRVALDYLSDRRRPGPAVVTDVQQLSPPAHVVVDLLAAAGSNPGVVVPMYRYEIGFPIVIDRSRWEAFMGRDQAPLDVIAAHRQWAADVRFDLNRPPRIRTAADAGAVAT